MLESGIPRRLVGLSPQERGNRRIACRGNPCRGPIPAGAGEPDSMMGRIHWVRAYPRRSGGTGK